MMIVRQVKVRGKTGIEAVLSRGSLGLINVVAGNSNASGVYDPDCPEEALWTARHLQATLDGYDGTPGDVEEYRRIVEMLAD